MAGDPAEHDRQPYSELVRACRLANEDPDVAASERETDALQDTIEEPWDESLPRGDSLSANSGSVGTE